MMWCVCWRCFSNYMKIHLRMYAVSILHSSAICRSIALGIWSMADQLHLRKIPLLCSVWYACKIHLLFFLLSIACSTSLFMNLSSNIYNCVLCIWMLPFHNGIGYWPNILRRWGGNCTQKNLLLICVVFLIEIMVGCKLFFLNEFFIIEFNSIHLNKIDLNSNI